MFIDIVDRSSPYRIMSFLCIQTGSLDGSELLHTLEVDPRSLTYLYLSFLNCEECWFLVASATAAAAELNI